MLEKVKDYLRKNDSWFSELLFCRYYERREKRNMKTNSIPFKRAEGENEYIEKWNSILRFSAPYAYRLYSHYVGANPYIVSETATIKINRILNPIRYDGYLSDKNNFDKILDPTILPKTILRIICGQLYDSDYNPIHNLTETGFQSHISPFERIIFKPTVESNSGHGIDLFIKKGHKFFNNKNEELTISSFLAKGDNALLQEGLQQCKFMSQFNSSSINTIRIATYRSVKDNKVHILSIVIRMGASGKFIDNLHGGGKMVRINSNQYLANHCIDQYGTSYKNHNGIDFTKRILFPYYTSVCELVKTEAKKLVDTRLIQWDIMINQNNIPRIIEFNINSFSFWIAQMTGTPAFGEYTDEIIEYVHAQLNKSPKG